MAYPLKFRQKVFATKAKFNLTFEETSLRFDIPIRTLFRWQNKLEPCTTRNKPATKIDMDALAKDVEKYPDAYQKERAARLGVAERTVGYALKVWDLLAKKTLNHPKADELARLTFQAKIQAYESAGRPIIYLDESGFAHDMPRTHGYSRKGERCHGVHDWQAKGRTNVIDALLEKTLIAIGLFKGSVNGDIFYAWLTQVLMPVLPAEAVVVMDNASFHKRADMRDALTEAGHQPEFLPAYSPDLNPIEKKWAQAKAIRRREHCAIDKLFAVHLTDGKL